MYKARIAKWGLDKKTKEAEAWAVLRVKVRRDAVGKDSEFRVRGKPVTVEDVLRYFKRKGIMHPEVPPQRSEASTPPAIEYWTPIPSPKPSNKNFQVPEGDDAQNRADFVEFHGTEMNGVQYATASISMLGNDNVKAYLNVDQTQQLLFSSPDIQSFEITRSPLPPQRLLVPEKLFASIRAYYGGALSSGVFKTDKYGHLRSVNEVSGNLLVDFYQLCRAGADLMNSKSFVQGRQCLSKASGLVSDLLREQDPSTLEHIFDLLLQFRDRDQNEILRILRYLLDGMVSRLFAEEHPWRQVFSQIGNLDDADFELALAEAWRCTCDILATFLGQFHRTTIYYYTNFLKSVYSPNGATQVLHDLLVRGEHELDEFDERLLDIKLDYGRALYLQGLYTEALEIFKELLDRCRDIDSQPSDISIILEMIALCQYGMGHEHEAELTKRQGIKVAEGAYGKFDSLVLQLKARLQEWLRSWGREAEAAALKVEMDEILGPDDIELEDITI